MREDLDKKGLLYFTRKIKALIPTKTSDLTNDSGFIDSVPVESVNGHTGAVNLSASDVGAMPDTYTPPVTSVNNRTGNVTLLASDLLDLVYPVGSLYLSAAATSPATLFGGTWTRIQDTFLLAAGSTYAAGTTGGEASHALTEAELPVISGSFDIRRWVSGAMVNNANGIVSRSDSDATGNSAASSGTSYAMQKVTVSFGSGQAHNNMPPYLAVYVWQRTA